MLEQQEFFLSDFLRANRSTKITKNQRDGRDLKWSAKFG